jgi:hypothetical protein
MSIFVHTCCNMFRPISSSWAFKERTECAHSIPGRHHGYQKPGFRSLQGQRFGDDIPLGRLDRAWISSEQSYAHLKVGLFKAAVEM